jgi:3-deoxy-D-manno-octulosonic acid kinase
MVARFNRDLYLAGNAERTRAFREFRLLKTLLAAGLPVPAAVAARAQCVVSLPLLSLYRCDLVTEQLSDVVTLSDALAEQALDPTVWHAVGRCLRAFHDCDVYHADLNARNILLRNNNCGEPEVYLIDFDNSYIRSSSPTWKNANLARLLRSLNKFRRNTDPFYFGKDEWGLLLEGYNGV